MIEEKNSHVSRDRLTGLDSYRDALKSFYELWCANVEKLVVESVRFAKRLNGFSALSINDQIVLIKAARPEITILIKFKHFKWSPRAFVDYRPASDSICVVPARLMSLMHSCSSSAQSDYYRSLYARFVFKVSCLLYSMSAAFYCF